jgi:beta-lactamase superfamily II metal-dependent hydrolase
MPATDLPDSRLDPPGGFLASAKPTDLIYFVLNVGDGDSQVLVLPEDQKGRRQCLIVDCIKPNKTITLLDDLVAAGALGATKPLLELVVATHPHDDHISGMAQLLRRYGPTGDIGEVWESGYYHTSSSYLEMMRELEDLSLRHLQPTGGTVRFAGKVRLTVLAPGAGLRNRFDSYGIDINNASIALKLDFPMARVIARANDRTYVRLPTTHTLILGADAQTLSWSQVLVDFPQLGPASTAVTTALRRSRGSEPLSGHIFKVPHHGSKHGLSLELVEAISPSLSIVSSVREAGKYHFPHAVMQAALREAIDPVSSKPGSAHRGDEELILLYTGSRLLDAQGAATGLLGSVGVLVGPGGRREVYGFGDDPKSLVDLGAGRRMK